MFAHIPISFLSFLTALAWPLLLGLVTLSVIVGNQRWPVSFTLALSFCMGMGVIGQLMLLLWGCFNVKVDLPSILTVNLFYAAILFSLFLWRKRSTSYVPLNFPSPQETPWGLAQKISFFLILAYIIYQLCSIFWSAFFIPIYQADAFTEHAYKAKVFFYEQSLKRAGYLWRFGYPLQIPLTMEWIALNIGQWNEGWIKMIFPCNCLAFVVIVYTFMRSWVDRLISLATVALMLTSILFVIHAAIAYCDFTVMLYTITALLLLCWGITMRSPAIILMAGLMSGFAASAKLEGIAYMALSLIVLVTFLLNKEFLERRFILKALLGFILPFIGILLILKIFQHYHYVAGLENYSLTVPFYAPQEILPRSLMIIKEWINNLYLSGNWGMTWFFLTGVWLLDFSGKKSFPFKFLSLAMALFFIHYAVGSLFAGRFIYLGGGKTLDESSRILLHFFPLCPIMTGLLMCNFLKCKKE